MQYMILDSASNALAALADELSARAVLHAIAWVEPEAADELVLLAYDDEGMPMGEAVTVFDVPPAVTIEPSEFVQARTTEAVERRLSVKQERYVASSLRGWEPRVQPSRVAELA